MGDVATATLELTRSLLSNFSPDFGQTRSSQTNRPARNRISYHRVCIIRISSPTYFRHFIRIHFSPDNTCPPITLPCSVLGMPMKVRFLGAKPDPGFLYGAASQFPPRQKSYFLCITIRICGAAALIIRRQSFGFRLFHKSYFHSSSGIVFPMRGNFVSVSRRRLTGVEWQWFEMIWEDWTCGRLGGWGARGLGSLGTHPPLPLPSQLSHSPRVWACLSIWLTASSEQGFCLKMKHGVLYCSLLYII